MPPRPPYPWLELWLTKDNPAQHQRILDSHERQMQRWRETIRVGELTDKVGAILTATALAAFIFAACIALLVRSAP